MLLTHDLILCTLITRGAVDFIWDSTWCEQSLPRPIASVLKCELEFPTWHWHSQSFVSYKFISICEIDWTSSASATCLTRCINFIFNCLGWRVNDEKDETGKHGQRFYGKSGKLWTCNLKMLLFDQLLNSTESFSLFNHLDKSLSSEPRSLPLFLWAPTPIVSKADRWLVPI